MGREEFNAPPGGICHRNDRFLMPQKLHLQGGTDDASRLRSKLSGVKRVTPGIFLLARESSWPHPLDAATLSLTLIRNQCIWVW